MISRLKTVLFSLFACVTFFVIHDVLLKIYTFLYQPQSHSAGLSFVFFTYVFLIVPVLFIYPHINKRFRLILVISLCLYCITFWGGTHPLRTALLLITFFFSLLSFHGYKYLYLNYIQRRSKK